MLGTPPLPGAGDRVVLVNPPLAIAGAFQLCQPIGLLLVGAALLDTGVRPTVVDLALELAEGGLSSGPGLTEDCARRLAAVEGDLYGFSVQCVSLPVVLDIARCLRRRRPSSRIVFGGHHASLLGLRVREQFPFVDEVVTGPGDAPASGLGLTPQDWRRPAYELAPSWERYAAVSERPMGLVEVARGCPFECSFCSIPLAYGRRARFKPPGAIVEEARWLVGEGCGEIHLVDDTFTLNRGHVERLLAAIEESRLGFTWTAMTRADLVTPALLRTMSAAGCHSILYGVESASAATLRSIDKHARRYPSLVDLARWHVDAAIAPTIYFLVNLPGDTRTAFEETLGVAARISVLDAGACHFQLPRFVPGTRLASQVAGRLTFEPNSPYARTLHETVGDCETVWSLVRGHPDLFSTYYAAPGPLPAATAMAVAWLGDTVFERFPYTLAGLAESGGIVGLFERLGRARAPSRRPGPADRAGPLAGAIDGYLASVAPALRPVAEFEDWLWRGTSPGTPSTVRRSRLDVAGARRAVEQGTPVSPALFGPERLYRHRTATEVS